MLGAAVRRTLHEARAQQVALPPTPSLGQIQALEQRMRAMGGTDDLPVTHRFADGLYARELFMPGDTVLVGKMHRKSHFFVVLEGVITAWTPDGMRRFGPGEVFLTVPGTKRAIYAHTDARLITFHATAQTDVGKVEDEIIVPAEQENDFMAGLLEYEL
jgi:quercetin dioxygenase-like cupin family protein